jgi:ferric-dicitrate binding protein FerR (iron transport regulator)
MAKSNIDRERLTRFFNSDSSSDQKEYLYEVFCNNENGEELEHHLRKHWYELLDDQDAPDNTFDNILYRLHYNINSKHKGPSPALSIFVRWFSRLAAIIVLPLLIFAGFQVYKTMNKATTWVEIQAPAYTRAQFSLPDGTHGWLNSNSSIKYSGDFTRNREVVLNGEAFFDVQKNPKIPFKVTNDDFYVTVTGTRFNIASYKNENSVEVVLEEGALECYYKRLDQSYALKPNDCISYDKTLKSCKVEVVQPEKYISWKDGKLVFRNDPLDVVARKLERWYNIEVEVAGDMSRQPRLRATFIDENLEEVMKLLKMSLQVAYFIEQPSMQNDYSYNKTKVKITPIPKRQ